MTSKFVEIVQSFAPIAIALPQDQTLFGGVAEGPLVNISLEFGSEKLK